MHEVNSVTRPVSRLKKVKYIKLQIQQDFLSGYSEAIECSWECLDKSSPQFEVYRFGPTPSSFSCDFQIVYSVFLALQNFNEPLDIINQAVKGVIT